MHRILLFLSSLFVATSLAGQDVKFYQVDELGEYQQVLKMALDQDKPLFVAIYEEDGGFEKMVRDGIFKNDSLAEAYMQVIPMAVEITSEMGARMAETFGVSELPSFFFLTNQEVLTVVESGYRTALQLGSALEKAQQNARLYTSLQEKYGNNQLSAEEWRQLIAFHDLNNSFNESMELALQYLAGLGDAELLQSANRPVLLKYGLNLENKYPAFIIKNRTSFDTAAYRVFYESAYSFNFDRALMNEDSVLLEKMVTALIPATPDKNADQPRLKFETRKVFAAETRHFGLWKKAALARSETENSDSLKAAFLFDEAYEIADNFNTPEAQQAARQLAAAAGKIDARFRYKMLEAYMAYLLKDYPTADKLVDEAATLSSLEQNQRKAAGLKKMIGKEMGGKAGE